MLGKMLSYLLLEGTVCDCQSQCGRVLLLFFPYSFMILYILKLRYISCEIWSAHGWRLHPVSISSPMLIYHTAPLHNYYDAEWLELQSLTPFSHHFLLFFLSIREIQAVLCLSPPFWFLLWHATCKIHRGHKCKCRLSNHYCADKCHSQGCHTQYYFPFCFIFNTVVWWGQYFLAACLSLMRRVFPVA